jgi:hypothetical protein
MCSQWRRERGGRWQLESFKGQKSVLHSATDWLCYFSGLRTKRDEATHSNQGDIFKFNSDTPYPLKKIHPLCYRFQDEDQAPASLSDYISYHSPLGSPQSNHTSLLVRFPNLKYSLLPQDFCTFCSICLKWSLPRSLYISQFMTLVFEPPLKGLPWSHYLK